MGMFFFVLLVLGVNDVSIAVLHIMRPLHRYIIRRNLISNGEDINEIFNVKKGSSARFG